MKVQALADGVSANKLSISPRDKRFWSDISQYCKDSGDQHSLNQVNNAVKISTGNTPNTDSYLNDGLIWGEAMRGYRSEVTRSPHNTVADWNIDIDAFGTNTEIDPRADEPIRFSISVAGEVARFCCGADPTTVSANLSAVSTKRGWYSIGFDICWTERLRLQYGGILDYMATMQRLCIELLEQARCEVAFYGDPVHGLRGLRQLPIERLYLPKPLDQMTYQEAYDTMVMIFNHAELTMGERGIIKSHMLHASGFGAVRAMMSDTAGCCDTLGDKLDKILDIPIKRRATDYMATAGENCTKAALLYKRDPRYFIRDMAFAPRWLAPEIHCGKLQMQAVMRLGELDVTNGRAGLLISNLLTSGC
jgi:hypothetical protein